MRCDFLDKSNNPKEQGEAIKKIFRMAISFGWPGDPAIAEIFSKLDNQTAGGLLYGINLGGMDPELVRRVGRKLMQSDQNNRG